MTNQKNLIKNASGELTEFMPERLIRSLEHSGAGKKCLEEIQHIIAQAIKNSPTPLSSKVIYRMAHRHLKRQGRQFAAKYSLKTAIQELGPSGYPFEILVGELFQFQGFDTQVGVTLEGRCVTHEVDVLALKGDNRVAFVECKFHNTAGRKNDIKTPLYVHSRYQDLNEGWVKRYQNQDWQTESWLVSNTRFSDDAIQYSRCIGMRLIGWDYPPNSGSLKDRIDRARLHPITTLTGLTKQEKTRLLDLKIVLVHHITDRPALLDSIHIPANRIRKILEEAELLMLGD